MGEIRICAKIIILFVALLVAAIPASRKLLMNRVLQKGDSGLAGSVIVELYAEI